MKRQRTWLVLVIGAVMLIVVGLIGYSHWQNPKQEIFSVSDQVVKDELLLGPQENAHQLSLLNQRLVNGSQADFFTQWLAGQLTTLVRPNRVQLMATHIHIAKKSLYSLSATRAVVDYRLTVTHIYHPHWSVTTTEVVTMWLSPSGAHGAPSSIWKVYAINFNYDPISFLGQRSSQSYDVWHLENAPAPPHGA